MAEVRDIVFIIDRSGSMLHLTGETVNGYNDSVAELRTGEGEARISLYLFNDTRQTLLERVSPDAVPAMTAETYCACGCTALVDSVFETVNEFDILAAYGGRTAPKDVLFMITTDGLENASTRHKVSELKKLIESVKKKHGWKFIFLGADLDAVRQAEDMGIDRKYAARYRNDSAGNTAKYMAMRRAASSYMADRRIREDWADCLDGENPNG